MTETFDLFQQGREHLAQGRAAQATVPLEKAKAREPETLVRSPTLTNSESSSTVNGGMSKV